MTPKLQFKVSMSDTSPRQLSFFQAST